MKPPYAIGSVPSLSGHAVAYRWRSLPRVRRHRASKPQGSSERVLPWQITMDQLIFASLSHTHYWYDGKQTWNKGSGQDYNNMILKGKRLKFIHYYYYDNRGLQHAENDEHLKKQLYIIGIQYAELDKVEVAPGVTVASLRRFRTALIGPTQGLPKRRRLCR